MLRWSYVSNTNATKIRVSSFAYLSDNGTITMLRRRYINERKKKKKVCSERYKTLYFWLVVVIVRLHSSHTIYYEKTIVSNTV